MHCRRPQQTPTYGVTGVFSYELERRTGNGMEQMSRATFTRIAKDDVKLESAGFGELSRVCPEPTLCNGVNVNVGMEQAAAEQHLAAGDIIMCQSDVSGAGTQSSSAVL